VFNMTDSHHDTKPAELVIDVAEPTAVGVVRVEPAALVVELAPPTSTSKPTGTHEPAKATKPCR
jgi:hypothetical protein